MRERIYSLIEICENLSFLDILNMPYKWFEEFIEFKNEVEKDKKKRAESQIKKQEDLKEKMKSMNKTKNTQQRLKNDFMQRKK